jgi:hypothetical protein
MLDQHKIFRTKTSIAFVYMRIETIE